MVKQLNLIIVIMNLRQIKRLFVSLLIGVLVLCAMLASKRYSNQLDVRTTSAKLMIIRNALFTNVSLRTPSSVDDMAMNGSARYRSRLNRLKEMCDRLNATREHVDVALHPSQFLVVDETHKLIYCNIPKVGCTNWKSIFLSLAGFDVARNSSIHRLGINKSGRRLLQYVHKYENITHRRYMLKNYKKFMVTRDPFTRLLSAYQDKLSPKSRAGTTTVSNPYTKYAINIIASLRGKAEARRVKNNMALYNLTFADFLHFLTHPPYRAYDRHWERINKLCSPCDVDYDIIGKYETIAEDSEYILKSAGIDIPFPSPGRNATHSSVETIVKSFYKDIPPKTLIEIYKKFYMDFKLFDYHPRTFTEGVFEKGFE